MKEMIHPVTYAGMRAYDCDATTQMLYQAVENSFGVEKERLQSKRRFREVVYGKIAFAQLSRQYQKKSTISIGKELGVDHSSIVHYGIRHGEMMLFDKHYRSMYLQSEGWLTSYSVGKRPLIVAKKKGKPQFTAKSVRELFPLIELRQLVLETICRRFDISQADLLGRISHRPARLRAHAYHYLHSIGLSYADCGFVFNRQRSSASDSCRNLTDKMEEDMNSRDMQREMAEVLGEAIIEAGKSLTFVGL
jgi:chromosomal replication initiation ATPase DnaA